MLNALSYGLRVPVLDIPANKEVESPPERYYRCRNVDDLKFMMGMLLKKRVPKEERQEIRKQIEEKYNWDNIADQTVKVYEKALAQRA